MTRLHWIGSLAVGCCLFASQVHAEDLQTLRDARVKANERGTASEYPGRWRMTLPAGFAYDVTLSQREDGLLVLDSEHKGLLLLGEFAVNKNKLVLVRPRGTNIEDYVWSFDKGQFSLVHQEHRHGADYTGATLRRVDWAG